MENEYLKVCYIKRLIESLILIWMIKKKRNYKLLILKIKMREMCL